MIEFESLLTLHPDVRIAAGRIDDHADSLWPEERSAVQGATAKRINEFSTGRLLARKAMAEHGFQPSAIPRCDRRPVWPPGLVGSITHAGDAAVAAVAPDDSIHGLGIDLEIADRLTEKLFPRVFTPSERATFAGADPRLPTLSFSAKEAGFKSVNPGVGRYIGFHEAEVAVNWQAQTWRLSYVGQHAANAVMEAGTGRFCFTGRYVLTVFMIPRQR